MIYISKVCMLIKTLNLNKKFNIIIFCQIVGRQTTPNIFTVSRKRSKVDEKRNRILCN